MKIVFKVILGIWSAITCFISPIWLTMVFLNITGLIYKYDYSMDDGTAIIIGLILFVMVIFSILALTLWPTYYWEEPPGVWGNLRILIERPSLTSELSLTPFSVFADYIEDLQKGPAMFFATLINF